MRSNIRRPSLKALSTFEAAAKHQSFKTAANQLGLTPSAVSHQVRLLEAEIGVQLFHRLGRGLALTDAGKAYMEMLAAAFEEIDSATRSIMSYRFADELIVRTPPSFASRWLVPQLPSFLKANSATNVRIEASSEAFDFRGDGADVAIWYARRQWPDNVEYIPLLSERVFPMCSPAVKAGHPDVRTPQDLLQHTLIHTERNIMTWASWFAAKGIALPAKSCRELSIDPSNLAIETAVAGTGYILESDLLAAEELEREALVPVFDSTAEDEIVSYYLVWPTRLTDVRKVDAFRVWIMDTISAGSGDLQREPVPADQ